MSKVREWAQEQGQEISLKGRLPKALIVDYLMAHPAEAREFLRSKGYTVGTRGRISAKDIKSAV